MKNWLIRILSLTLLVFAPVAHSDSATQSFVSAPSQSQPMIVDTWGATGEGIADAAGKITSVAQTATGFLQNLLMDWRNGGDLTLKVSECLEDLGLPGGRVLQASILKGVGEALDTLGKTIDAAVKISKIADAIKSGDRDAFKKVVADVIIDAAAKALGEVASKATFAFLTGATVGWGALPAWAAGELVGMGIESGVKWLLDKYGREALENLIGKVWDFFADPFDSNPQNPGGNTGNGSNQGSGKKDGYQGLKPIHLF